MTDRKQQFEDQWLETIVRMVVERLREQVAFEAPLSVPRIIDKENRKDNNSLRTCTSRVITLGLLRNELQGVKTLRVASKALVTPAVIDELKDRGISLERCDTIIADPPAGGPTAHLPSQGGTIQNRNEPTTQASGQAHPNRSFKSFVSLPVVADDDSACRSTATALSEAVRAVPPCFGDSTQKLVRLAEQKVSATSLPVIVTCDPLDTVWQLHRKGVRCAACRTASEISEAIDSFAAAIIVIDGRGGPSRELEQALGDLRS